jgi:hypothetical protein
MARRTGQASVRYNNTQRPELPAAFLARIRSEAFFRLSERERTSTNLYLDPQIYRRGSPLGPAEQRLFADRDCVLVFADDHPLKNFSHHCRYFLFDIRSGHLFATLKASFPPYVGRFPQGYEAFSYPVANQPRSGAFGINLPDVVPMAVPQGARYAILFSGDNELRHMNTLEFCYRTLVDHFGFNVGDIFVLNGDSSTNDPKGNPPPPWPGGDGTSPYRMVPCGQGDKPAFQGVLQNLKTKLKSEDLLFIFTGGHGSLGKDSQPAIKGCAGNYEAKEFSKDLRTLPRHRALIVMMSQCHSGGFKKPVVAASKAKRTTIACAVPRQGSSTATSDGSFDAFACNWIAAQLGFRPDGLTKTYADTSGDGSIEAYEAFDYTKQVNATYPPDMQDSPVHKDSSRKARNLTLGATLSAPLTWHALIGTAMKRFDLTPERPDALALFRKYALPQLQDLVLPVLQVNGDEVRAKLTPNINAIIRTALEKK